MNPCHLVIYLFLVVAEAGEHVDMLARFTATPLDPVSVNLIGKHCTLPPAIRENFLRIVATAVAMSVPVRMRYLVGSVYGREGSVMDNANQSQKAENFRALHHGAASLVLPNAWDAGTAVLVANAGFPAIATTSAGVAFAMGRADGQQISRDDMLRAIESISARVSLPVTADIEAGYGDTPEEVGETGRLSIEAGAVGINLEDGIDHAAGTLYELPLAVERIAAARDAGQAAGVPLVINGRTDVYFSPSLSDEEKFDEAVSRANAYIEAGADCAFVIRVAEADAIRDLAAAPQWPAERHRRIRRVWVWYGKSKSLI